MYTGTILTKPSEVRIMVNILLPVPYGWFM